jgi:urease accessory protein
MGFVVATGGLHAIGISVGLVHGRPRGPALLRIAGAVVAAAGVVFMWRAIA